MIESTAIGRNFLLSSARRKAIIDDFNLDYTEVYLQKTSEDTVMKRIDAQLQAADHLIEEFTSVIYLIESASMAKTNQEILFEILQDFLYPRISDNYLGTLDPTPETAAKIATWIDEFIKTMDSVNKAFDFSGSWRKDRDDLISLYLEKAVRLETRGLLRQALLLHSEDDIQVVEESRLGTGLPEQISYIFQRQINLCDEMLPDGYAEHVLGICNEELASSVCDMQLKIGSEWKDMNACYFCALINDANLMAEQCEDRHEELLDENPELLKCGNRTVTDLLELSLLAVNLCCQRIMLDLCDPEKPVLGSVGDLTWEVDQECIAMEQTMATLKDYIVDLQIWLKTEYHFFKILKELFDSTIKTYIESFFANTIARGSRDPQAVAQELHQDYLRLVIFFNGPAFEAYFDDRSCSFYSQRKVNDDLRLLQSMSAIISPENEADFVHNDIVTILDRFPNDQNSGSAAILHLAGLRKRHGRAESLIWIKAIASAQKEKESKENQRRREQSISKTLPIPLQVPDVRNSRFIRNVRCVPRDLEREISERSKPHVAFAQKLVGDQSPWQPAWALQEAVLTKYELFGRPSPIKRS